MKKILLLVSIFFGLYYFYKYKEMKEIYLLDLIDIETKEDLQERQYGYLNDEVTYVWYSTAIHKYKPNYFKLIDIFIQY